MRLAQKILNCFFALYCVAALANPATVYVNGDILTMQGDTPQYVEALVVQNDKIMFAGDKVQALAQAGANPTLYDLNGRTLMPGFIDSWGHFSLIAQNTLGVNLGYFAQNPPKTKAQAIQKLLTEGKLFNGWIVGSGYSEAMLSDGGLSLADLDKAFPDQPLLIQNISTLTGLVNTAGLKKLAITPATQAVGGFIPKDPKTGALTGELVGSPFMDAVVRAVGTYSQDITFDTYRKAEHVYLSNGFTTAQSYEATIDDMNKMRTAVEQKVISLDLITLSNHTWLYGDVYLKILGEERAKNISPLNSAIKLGVKIGIHNDMPSSGPNVLFSVWSAVNRKTFSGKTLGEEQRIDAYKALQGFTVNAAYQYKEETSKGLLAKGMLADLVELDRNPLKVDTDELKNIRVVQTIKHGKQLYKAQ